MPARFATDIWSPRVGRALQESGDESANAALVMAKQAVGQFGNREIAELQGKMDASRRGIGASSGGSGFNWGGAAQGVINGLGGLFGGGDRSGSPNPGFGMKGNLYDYKPSGLDFSSGWR